MNCTVKTMATYKVVRDKNYILTTQKGLEYCMQRFTGHSVFISPLQIGCVRVYRASGVNRGQTSTASDLGSLLGHWL